MFIHTNPAPRPTKALPEKSQEETKKECDCKEPGILNRTLDMVEKGVKTLTQEGLLMAKNDPALAFRAAATTLSNTGPLLTGIGTAIKVGFEAAMPVAMRGALLAGNAYRAVTTFKNTESSKIERTIDAGVVINDAIGLAGGVAMLAASGPVAAAGAAILGFSYAVDALTHAYRGMNHVGDRLHLWSAGTDQAEPPQDGDKQPKT